MVDVEELIVRLGTPDPRTRIGAAWDLLSSAVSQKADIRAAIPALADALSDNKLTVRKYSAGALRWVAANRGADMTAAMPALVKALSDPDADVRLEVAWALERTVQNLEGGIRECTSLNQLDRTESRFREQYSVLRTRCWYGKERELERIGLAFSKLMNETAKRRDALAANRDVLLEDVLRPPKDGTKIYHEMRRARNA